MPDKPIKYSVIVILQEQQEDFAEYIQNLYDLFMIRGESFEIIIPANSTRGFLKNKLPKLRKCNANLKAFELKAGTPESVCLKAALRESSGEIIVVCGPYQQITDDSFNQLLNSLDNRADIVTSWRQKRVDPRFNQFQSIAFNNIVRWITRTNLHDLSSAVKVFRREVLENTDLYGNMYRFLPIMAERKGFTTREVKCEHYQERGKTGFYTLNMYLTRFIDIFTLYFNTRFTRKPLRFFSAIGTTFLAMGALLGLYILVQRLFLDYPIGGRAVVLLALLLLVLGVQAASVGLLGEIIVFSHGRKKKEYTVEKII
jgi:hypothetical protein